MASLGAYLRELRDKRGTSLEEIARSTRVAARDLESLEAEQYAALPAPVFTRGFIRAYCQFFGVAPDEALALYDQREGAAVAPPSSPRVAAAARNAARPRPAAATSVPASDSEEPRRRSAVLVSFILLVVLGVALFAVTLMIQPSRDVERRAVIRSAPAESRSPEPPAAVTSPAPAPSEAPAAPAPPPAAVEAGSAPTFTSPYRLVARAVEPTWIRVRTEDGRSTEETLPPGEVREWVSDRPFVLTVGNAGGITLELNGRELPSLGARGAVIPRLVVPPEAR
ncbi:MAG: helix-turn-helix domain-containing protein [Candidatus Rokuibacteriota bacterium]